MAVRRAYRAGDVARVRARGPVRVIAPDGMELVIPAPRGRVDVWLAQPGEWTWTADDGQAGSFTVGEAGPPRIVTCELEVSPGPPSLAGYVRGQTVRVDAHFRDDHGRNADVTCVMTAVPNVENPKPERLEVARVGPGHYVAALTFSEHGLWRVTASGDGAVAERRPFVAF